MRRFEPAGAIRALGNLPMFANYFRTALRNILRHKVHALVTLVGFAAAMAAAIPVLLFVLDDFAFDTRR